LTLTASGELVRSAVGLAVGSEVVTRFADGSARSRVESTEIRNDRVEEKDEEMS